MSSVESKSAINSWRQGRFKRAKVTADLLQSTHSAHRWNNTIWALTLRPLLGALLLGPFLLWVMILGMRNVINTALYLCRIAIINFSLWITARQLRNILFSSEKTSFRIKASDASKPRPVSHQNTSESRYDTLCQKKKELRDKKKKLLGQKAEQCPVSHQNTSESRYDTLCRKKKELRQKKKELRDKKKKLLGQKAEQWKAQGLMRSSWSRALVWNEGWRCITALMSLLFSLLQGVVIASAVDKMLGNFANIGDFLHEHFSDGVDVALEAAFGAVTAQVNHFLTWSFVKDVFTNGFFPAKESGENTWLKWMGRTLALVVAAVAATVMAILTLYSLMGSATLLGMGFDAALVDTFAWIGFGTTSLVYTVLFCKDTIELADSIFAQGRPWQNIKALWATAHRQVENNKALEGVVSRYTSYNHNHFKEVSSLLLQRYLEFGVPQEEFKAKFNALFQILNLHEGSYETFGYAGVMKAVIQSTVTDPIGRISFIFSDKERQRYGQLLHDQQYSDVKPSAVAVVINAFAEAALTAGQAIWNLPATIMSALSLSAGSAAACSRPLTDSPDRGQPIKNFMLKNGLSLLLVALVITGAVFMAMITNIDLTHHIGWVTEQMANAAVSVMVIGSIGFMMVSAWKMGQAITSGIRQSWYNFWHNCKEAGLGRAIKEMLVAVKHEGYPIYRNPVDDQLYQHVNGAYLPLAKDASQKREAPSTSAGQMELQQRPPLLSLLAGLSTILTLSAMVLGILTIAGVAVSMPAGLPIYLALGCLAFRRLLSGMERAHQDREMLMFSEDGAVEQDGLKISFVEPTYVIKEQSPPHDFTQLFEIGRCDQNTVRMGQSQRQFSLSVSACGKHLFLDKRIRLVYLREKHVIALYFDTKLKHDADMTNLLGNIPSEFDLILADNCSPQQVAALACNANDQGRAIAARSSQVINEWLQCIKRDRALVPALMSQLIKCDSATDLSSGANWLLTQDFITAHSSNLLSPFQRLAEGKAERVLLAFSRDVPMDSAIDTMQVLHQVGLTVDGSKRCDVLYSEDQANIQQCVNIFMDAYRLIENDQPTQFDGAPSGSDQEKQRLDLIRCCSGRYQLAPIVVSNDWTDLMLTALRPGTWIVTPLCDKVKVEGMSETAQFLKVINEGQDGFYLKQSAGRLSLTPIRPVASNGPPDPKSTSTALGLTVGNPITHEQRFFGSNDPTGRDQRSIERGSEDPGPGPNSVA